MEKQSLSFRFSDMYETVFVIENQCLGVRTSISKNNVFAFKLGPYNFQYYHTFFFKTLLNITEK